MASSWSFILQINIFFSPSTWFTEDTVEHALNRMFKVFFRLQHLSCGEAACDSLSLSLSLPLSLSLSLSHTDTMDVFKWRFISCTFRGAYENLFQFLIICIYLPSLAWLSSPQIQALFTKQKRELYLVATFRLL